MLSSTRQSIGWASTSSTTSTTGTEGTAAEIAGSDWTILSSGLAVSNAIGAAAHTSSSNDNDSADGEFQEELSVERIEQLASSSAPVHRVLSVSLLVDYLSSTASSSNRISRATPAKSGSSETAESADDAESFTAQNDEFLERVLYHIAQCPRRAPSAKTPSSSRERCSNRFFTTSQNALAPSSSAAGAAGIAEKFPDDSAAVQVTPTSQTDAVVPKSSAGAASSLAVVSAASHLKEEAIPEPTKCLAEQRPTQQQLKSTASLAAQPLTHTHPSPKFSNSIRSNSSSSSSKSPAESTSTTSRNGSGAESSSSFGSNRSTSSNSNSGLYSSLSFASGGRLLSSLLSAGGGLSGAFGSLRFSSSSSSHNNSSQHEDLSSEAAARATNGKKFFLESASVYSAPVENNSSTNVLGFSSLTNNLNSSENFLLNGLQLSKSPFSAEGLHADNTAARKALCARSGDLAACLRQADPEAGYRQVYEVLLPLFESLMQTAEDWATKKAAADAILLLATHLRAKERLEQVLPIALSLSSSMDSPMLRLLAVGFLHFLFDISSSVVSRNFVLPQLLFLAEEDPHLAVRRSALRKVAAVAAAVETSLFTTRFLPLFRRLLEDTTAVAATETEPEGDNSSNSKVDVTLRAAAVASLYDIAKASKFSVRLRVLLPLLQKLLRDPEPVIRFAAQQQLGRFLSLVGPSLCSVCTAQLLHKERLLQRPHSVAQSPNCPLRQTHKLKSQQLQPQPVQHMPSKADPQNLHLKAEAEHMHSKADPQNLHLKAEAEHMPSKADPQNLHLKEEQLEQSKPVQTQLKQRQVHLKQLEDLKLEQDQGKSQPANEAEEVKQLLSAVSGRFLIEKQLLQGEEELKQKQLFWGFVGEDFATKKKESSEHTDSQKKTDPPKANVVAARVTTTPTVTTDDDGGGENEPSTAAALVISAEKKGSRRTVEDAADEDFNSDEADEFQLLYPEKKERRSSCTFFATSQSSSSGILKKKKKTHTSNHALNDENNEDCSFFWGDRRESGEEQEEEEAAAVSVAVRALLQEFAEMALDDVLVSSEKFFEQTQLAAAMQSAGGGNLKLFSFPEEAHLLRQVAECYSDTAAGLTTGFAHAGGGSVCCSCRFCRGGSALAAQLSFSAASSPVGATTSSINNNNSPFNSSTNSMEIATHPAACTAFAFAAVTVAMAAPPHRKGWRYLEEAFTALTHHQCKQVRKSLAASFHLIAGAVLLEEQEECSFPCTWLRKRRESTDDQEQHHCQQEAFSKFEDACETPPHTSQASQSTPSNSIKMMTHGSSCGPEASAKPTSTAAFSPTHHPTAVILQDFWNSKSSTNNTESSAVVVSSPIDSISPVATTTQNTTTTTTNSSSPNSSNSSSNNNDSSNNSSKSSNRSLSHVVDFEGSSECLSGTTAGPAQFSKSLSTSTTAVNSKSSRVDGVHASSSPLLPPPPSSAEGALHAQSHLLPSPPPSFFNAAAKKGLFECAAAADRGGVVSVMSESDTEDLEGSIASAKQSAEVTDDLKVNNRRRRGESLEGEDASAFRVVFSGQVVDGNGNSNDEGPMFNRLCLETQSTKKSRPEEDFLQQPLVEQRKLSFLCCGVEQIPFSLWSAEDRTDRKEMRERRQLLPAIEALLLDTEADVQMAALGHIAQTLKCFGATGRLSVLSSLQQVVISSKLFWSARLLLAQQLEPLFLLMDSQLLNPLLSLAFTLLQDPVAIVRKAACRCVPALLTCGCRKILQVLPVRAHARLVYQLSCNSNNNHSIATTTTTTTTTTTITTTTTTAQMLFAPSSAICFEEGPVSAVSAAGAQVADEKKASKIKRASKNSDFFTGGEETQTSCESPVEKKAVEKGDFLKCCFEDCKWCRQQKLNGLSGQNCLHKGEELGERHAASSSSSFSSLFVAVNSPQFLTQQQQAVKNASDCKKNSHFNISTTTFEGECCDDEEQQIATMRHFLTKGDEVAIICTILETFAESPRYAIRQLFIHMCNEIIRHCPKSLFELYFMRALAYLSRDKVANVRLTWARLLLPHLRKPSGKLKDNCLLVCAAKSLQKTEEDREMRYLLDHCSFVSDEDLLVVDGFELRDFRGRARAWPQSVTAIAAKATAAASTQSVETKTGTKQAKTKWQSANPLNTGESPTTEATDAAPSSYTRVFGGGQVEFNKISRTTQSLSAAAAAASIADSPSPQLFVREKRRSLETTDEAPFVPIPAARTNDECTLYTLRTSTAAAVADFQSDAAFTINQAEASTGESLDPLNTRHNSVAAATARLAAKTAQTLAVTPNLTADNAAKTSDTKKAVIAEATPDCAVASTAYINSTENSILESFAAEDIKHAIQTAHITNRITATRERGGRAAAATSPPPTIIKIASVASPKTEEAKFLRAESHSDTCASNSTSNDECWHAVRSSSSMHSSCSSCVAEEGKTNSGTCTETVNENHYYTGPCTEKSAAFNNNSPDVADAAQKSILTEQQHQLQQEGGMVAVSVSLKGNKKEKSAAAVPTVVEMTEKTSNAEHLYVAEEVFHDAPSVSLLECEVTGTLFDLDTAAASPAVKGRPSSLTAAHVLPRNAAALSPVAATITSPVAAESAASFPEANAACNGKLEGLCANVKETAASDAKTPVQSITTIRAVGTDSAAAKGADETGAAASTETALPVAALSKKEKKLSSQLRMNKWAPSLSLQTAFPIDVVVSSAAISSRGGAAETKCSTSVIAQERNAKTFDSTTDECMGSSDGKRKPENFYDADSFISPSKIANGADIVCSSDSPTREQLAKKEATSAKIEVYLPSYTREKGAGKGQSNPTKFTLAQGTTLHCFDADKTDTFVERQNDISRCAAHGDMREDSLCFPSRSITTNEVAEKVIVCDNPSTLATLKTKVGTALMVASTDVSEERSRNIKHDEIISYSANENVAAGRHLSNDQLIVDGANSGSKASGEPLMFVQQQHQHRSCTEETIVISSARVIRDKTEDAIDAIYGVSRCNFRGPAPEEIAANVGEEATAATVEFWGITAEEDLCIAASADARMVEEVEALFWRRNGEDDGSTAAGAPYPENAAGVANIKAYATRENEGTTAADAEADIAIAAPDNGGYINGEQNS